MIQLDALDGSRVQQENMFPTVSTLVLFDSRDVSVQPFIHHETLDAFKKEIAKMLM